MNINTNISQKISTDLTPVLFDLTEDTCVFAVLEAEINVISMMYMAQQNPQMADFANDLRSVVENYKFIFGVK